MTREYQTAIVDIPEYARIGMTFYVMSPSTDLTAAIKVDGARQLNPRAFPDGLRAALLAMNGMCGAEDARAMTAVEVSDYIRDQEEHEDHE